MSGYGVEKSGSRIRKAGVVIQSESKCLRTRGADGVTPSPEAKGFRNGEGGGPTGKSARS